MAKAEIADLYGTFSCTFFTLKLVFLLETMPARPWLYCVCASILEYGVDFAKIFVPDIGENFNSSQN